MLELVRRIVRFGWNGLGWWRVSVRCILLGFEGPDLMRVVINFGWWLLWWVMVFWPGGVRTCCRIF